MVTAEEYIAKPTGVFWIHALDALKHILRGDPKATAFHHPQSEHEKSLLADLRRSMEEHLEHDQGFDELTERTNFRARKRVAQWDETGDLEVGAFIDKEERCFIDYPKHEVPDWKGITILVDMTIPWRERDEHYMEERHRRAYETAIQAEADGVPCRMIGALVGSISEFKKARCYCVIKDFNDPIFPGIWGALRTNATTNDFINTIADYLVGTNTGGNWQCSRGEDITEDFDDDEVVILDPAISIRSNKFERR